jgi:hypothetical protein
MEDNRLPDVFAMLQEIEARLEHAHTWEKYIAGLTPPYHEDPQRNDTLENILEMLDKLNNLTGWDIGRILLLAGCTSAVDDEPHRTAPTRMLQHVLANMYRMHEVAAMVTAKLQENSAVHNGQRAQLTSRLLSWSKPSDAPEVRLNTALAAIRRRNWEEAHARATTAVEAACRIIEAVAESASPLLVTQVANDIAPSEAALPHYIDLVAILVVTEVLELSGGNSEGYLFLPVR